MGNPKESKKKGSKQAILKQKEYAEFVMWTATPSDLRDPATHQELAKKLNVAPDTLVDWKKKDGFWDEVEAQLKLWMKDKTGEVLGKLHKQIMKEGKSAEVKLWLQYGQGFTEKVQVEDKALARVFNIEAMLKKIAGVK